MNNNNINVRCDDIYEAEMNKFVQTVKIFKETWMHSSANWGSKLLKFADADFYFYDFAIGRLESNGINLLSSIICKVMAKYGYSFKVPKDRRSKRFPFLLCNKGKSVGYTFEDIYEDEDLGFILHTLKVDEICIIRPWKGGRTEKYIFDENEGYISEKQKIRAVTVEELFNELFSEKEYSIFENYLENCLASVNDIIGIKTIKFLSSMNLSAQRVNEESTLRDWDYKSYNYQIVNPLDPKSKKYINLAKGPFPVQDLNSMINNYIGRDIYKTMLGTNEYATSFVTSEWLFNSLKEKSNFDYTSVISGYLKSIEQLLYQIVMINIDNNCKISLDEASDVRKKAIKNHVNIYNYNNGGWVITNNTKGYPYIDFTSLYKEYMSSSIGAFEHFLKFNPHIFINPSLSVTISRMVSCFRTECRNGYFHTHNLFDWNIVEKVRENAIYLYFVLLGACNIPKEKEYELKIISLDSFDELCKRIREAEHYRSFFIFEDANGQSQKLFYDAKYNTVEYNESGIEHYERLLFYKVDDFTDEELEKFEEYIPEEKKVYLTRESIPKRILCFGRNHELKVIL